MSKLGAYTAYVKHTLEQVSGLRQPVCSLHYQCHFLDNQTHIWVIGPLHLHPPSQPGQQREGPMAGLTVHLYVSLGILDGQSPISRVHNCFYDSLCTCSLTIATRYSNRLLLTICTGKALLDKVTEGMLMENSLHYHTMHNADCLGFQKPARHRPDMNWEQGTKCIKMWQNCCACFHAMLSGIA